jgi:SAM-dependent methyltransferase
MPTRHLDLGCGLSPRNPFNRDQVFGCDIRDIGDEVGKIGFEYRKVNLVMQAIPFPDSYFDSISAFDFFEHVPRQLILPSGEGRNPFIELMNEIHRVLGPGGRLLALTPAYPHPAVFTDPTHVNFITEDTHAYFVGEEPGAAMYGFNGRFDAVNVGWDAPGNVYELDVSPLRKWIRRFHRKWFKGGLSHQVWDFSAVKKA